MSPLKPLLVIALLVITIGCSPRPSGQEPYEAFLKQSLQKISYDNGISITEAKIIADAYLYQYAITLANKPSGVVQRNKQRWHVKIRTGDGEWLGDVYTGRAIDPVPAQTPPVKINKKNGEITWEQLSTATLPLTALIHSF